MLVYQRVRCFTFGRLSKIGHVRVNRGEPFNRVFFYDPVVSEESDLELWVCIFAIEWEAKKLLRVSQPYIVFKF